MSWDEALAGGVGGACGVLLGHPLDTLKARLQQPASFIHPAGPSRALWRGLAAPLLTASSRACLASLSTLTNAPPENALCFHAYSASASALASAAPADSDAHALWRVYVCGCVAGVATTLLVVPVDLVKLQQQTATGAAAPGTLQLAASIVRREGLRGLYRGTGVTLIRDVPSSGVYFAVYEWLVRSLPQTAGLGDKEATFVAGGFAGVASWGCIYPLDVCKSRLQAQPGRYAGLADCFRRTLAEEGWSALSRGLGACLGRAFVVNAAIFSGVEAARSMLKLPT